MKPFLCRKVFIRKARIRFAHAPEKIYYKKLTKIRKMKETLEIQGEAEKKKILSRFEL